MTGVACGYRLVEGTANMSLSDVHEMLVDAYWCKGTSRERVAKAAAGSSLVIGAFFGQKQVAYARVVSDKTTFGWICDVIVHEDHRGKGLGRAMVRYALEHPEHQRFRRWVLATKDAQEVYAAAGFEPIDHPERWMAYRPEDAPERAGGGPDVV